MPFYIQSKEKTGVIGERKWRTWEKRPFETATAAQEKLKSLGYWGHEDFRVAESYTVTRYKPVKM